MLPSNELLSAVEKAIARHDKERAFKGELEALWARLSSLTPRQRQVFEMVVRGKTNKHAAPELGCTERTIKAHRQLIMEKMQVRTVPQLVTIAERLHVLGPRNAPND